MEEIHYNHDRPLESFQADLDKIRQAGFKPIAVTQMVFEDTFVFETSEEAKRAYEQFEECYYRKEGEITTEEQDEEIERKSVVGWWYGRENFLEAVKDYESGEGSSKVKIYWL